MFKRIAPTLAFGLFTLLVILFLIVTTHSRAFADTVPVVPVTTGVPASGFQINVEPIITALLQCVGIVLVALLGWVSVWAKQYFKSKTATLLIGQVDDALSKSITVGVQSADAAIRAKGWDSVEVKNQTLAVAANYMVGQFPDKVKAMGFDPTDPATVTKLVDGALNRAFPAAAAVAAASPATPPAPAAAAPAAA